MQQVTDVVFIIFYTYPSENEYSERKPNVRKCNRSVNEAPKKRKLKRRSVNEAFNVK